MLFAGPVLPDWARRVALAFAALVGLLLLTATPAHAHAQLVRTDPATGTVLPAGPGQVTLTFSEDVGIALGRLSVMAPDGRTASDGAAFQLSPDQVAVRLHTGLPHGTYVVSYRVVSADGHPVSGGFPFSVVEPSLVDQAAPTGQDLTGASPGYVLVALSVGKYLGYVGVILLVGAVLRTTLLRTTPLRTTPLRPDDPGATTAIATTAIAMARWGWGLLLAGTGLAVAAQVPYAAGVGLTGVRWSQLVAAASTTVVQAQLVRIGVLVAAAPLLRAGWAGRRLGGVAGPLAAAGAVLLFLTWPMSGHAGAGRWPALAVPLDALHVAAISVWIGGLVVLVRDLLRTADGRDLAVLLPRWSRIATGAVVVLAGSGTVEAAVQLGSPGALVATTYGRLLLAKVVALGLVLLVAASGRRAIRRRYPPGAPVPPMPTQRKAPGGVAVLTAVPQAPPDPVRTAVRRRAAVEIAASVVIIALATLLVQSSPSGPPAAAAAAPGPAVGGPFYSIDRLPGLTLQVDMTPAQVGSNTMLLTLLTPDGQPLPAKQVTVRAALPSADLSNVQVPVEQLSPGIVYAFPQLPRPGDWHFAISIDTGTGEPTAVSRIVRIY